MLSTVAFGLLAVTAIAEATPSPATISVSSRRISPDSSSFGSSSRRRSVAPANLPLADFYKGTDLQYAFLFGFGGSTLMPIQDGMATSQ